MAREGEVHVTWQESEWEQFATLLARAAPRAKYAESADLATVSVREMNEAGAKMPRPRQFASVSQSRPKILAAFARLRQKAADSSTESAIRAQPAPTAAGAAPTPEDETAVRWNDPEWEEFAALLHAATPQRDYLHSPDLAAMSVRELKEAGAKMNRPRTKFASVSLSRTKLLAAYARLRDKLPGSDESIGPAPTGTARRAPPPAEPPSPLKLDANGRPAAALPAEPPPEKPSTDLFAVVAWERREWLAIATEIDRMYPGSGYSHREHLAGLTSEDVAFAQRVLPVERQNRHIKVASFCTLRAQLQQGFNDLKEQRRQQAEADAQAARQAQQDAERHAQEALAKASAPPASVNPYEAAFAPLMDLIVGMLVERVRPMLADAITQALNAPAHPAAEAPATVAETPAPAAIEPTAKNGRIKPLLHVGIVGNRSTYADDLRRDFPSVEFTCIDSKRTVGSLRNCDRILVLTKFIGHDLTNAVKRAVGPERGARVTLVSGSLSDVRRLVTGMLNTQPAPAPQQRIPSFAH